MKPTMTGESLTLGGNPLDVAEPNTRLAAERTAMAVERTRLAQDRTLMAWVRTATSLISFGFTVYKAFQYLEDRQAASMIARAFTPRGFALTMILVGIGSLALATIEHWRGVRSLYQTFGHPAPRSMSRIVAGVVAGLGIIALVLVFLGE